MTEITRRATLAGAAASALLPFVKTSPASAAAPPAATQNASFYRYNVGTHQITVVCDGVATVNLTDNYAAGASKDDINKIFAENHLPTDKVTHTFNPVVVNTGPKLVVIDTGLGPDQFTQTKGKVGQFHTTSRPPASTARRSTPSSSRTSTATTSTACSRPRTSRPSPTPRSWFRQWNGSSGWMTAR